jgi:hypothetical protein
MNLGIKKCIKTLFSYFKYGLAVVLVPIVLNYAALNQEATVLSKHGN